MFVPNKFVFEDFQLIIVFAHRKENYQKKFHFIDK